MYFGDMSITYDLEHAVEAAFKTVDSKFRTDATMAQPYHDEDGELVSAGGYYANACLQSCAQVRLPFEVGDLDEEVRASLISAKIKVVRLDFADYFEDLAVKLRYK